MDIVKLAMPTLQNFLTLVVVILTFLHTQVQEGLVKLSKEHLCPEGGLPLSGLYFFEVDPVQCIWKAAKKRPDPSPMASFFAAFPIDNVADAALRERLVDSLAHWTDPNARRGDCQKTCSDQS